MTLSSGFKLFTELTKFPLSSVTAEYPRFMIDLGSSASRLFFKLRICCSYDSINELMPRMIASSQRITINQALFPKILDGKPIIKEKRERGIQALRENAEFFSMHDATEGQTVQYIEAVLAKRHQELELIAPDEYQIVVFIDNFHDIMVDDSVRGLTEDNARFDFISGRLN